MVCSEVIKIATQKSHAEAEAVLVRRIKGIGSAEDYEELLSSFYGFFVPLEVLVSGFIGPDVLADIDTRRKSGSIKRFISGTLPPTAAPHFLPSITSLPKAFGVLYVLEGSTLGGKIISRMLQSKITLQLSPDSLLFFDAYGDKTFEMWARFKTVIDELLIDKGEIEAATATALDTFNKMKTWMKNTNS
jgi:heme oxygenase